VVGAVAGSDTGAGTSQRYRRPTLIGGYEIEIDGLAALEEGAAA
jgi:hypothetical protein